MKSVKATKFISTTPDKIISAFTDHHTLKQWWGVERSLITLNPGSPYMLAWKVSGEGLGVVCSGAIGEYLFAQKLVVTNLCYLNPDRQFLGPMKLTIKVRETEKGAKVSVCQEGYRDGHDWEWYHDAVATAWPQILQALKAFLEK